MFATVFAAGGGCGCDALRRQDTDAYRYFCGEGTAKSLSEARKFATEHALARASGTLQRSQSQAGGDLTSYVRSVSSEVAACPVSGPRGFTMFVLLRLPSTLTTANAQQAFVRPIPASARIRIRLDKIRVIQDGSTATTGWLFEVRAGGKSFRLPNKNYSDRPSQNEFVPAAADAAVLDVDGGSSFRIEVLGRRSFGGDTASGAQAIATGSSTTVVAVRNAISPNKGSFEFTFSTERLDAP